MKNPYDVLQVSPVAGDSKIKEAYVQMVKAFPPDRSPEKFKEIRKAYETIATPRDRVNYKLFSIEDMPNAEHLEHLMLNLTKSEHRGRIPPKKLIETIIKKYQKSPFFIHHEK